MQDHDKRILNIISTEAHDVVEDHIRGKCECVDPWDCLFKLREYFEEMQRMARS